MANTYCMDLGTYDLKIYNKHTDKITVEKNAIAVINGFQLYNYGTEAYEMYERAPGDIEISFPIKEGVIAEYNYLEAVLTEIFEKLKGFPKGSDIFIAIPTDISEVEKKAFFDIFFNSKIHPKNVHLCDKPIADAVGMGLDPTEDRAILLLDLGDATTEISLMTNGGIVYSKLLEFGSNIIDKQIISAVRKEYNVSIGTRSAKKIKENLGCALPGRFTEVKVKGRDMTTGLPTEISVKAKTVFSACQSYTAKIIDAYITIYEKIQPELKMDIKRNGIYLTGGGSKLMSMDDVFRFKTGLTVNTSNEPEMTAIRGLSIISSKERLKRLTFSMKKKKGLFR